MTASESHDAPELVLEDVDHVLVDAAADPVSAAAVSTRSTVSTVSTPTSTVSSISTY